MRRTTLRGQENLNKRFKLAAVCNLSQLMRKLFGVGTPKQQEALGRAIFCFPLLLRRSIRALVRQSFKPVLSSGSGLSAPILWPGRSSSRSRPFFNNLVGVIRFEISPQQAIDCCGHPITTMKNRRGEIDYAYSLYNLRFATATLTTAEVGLRQNCPVDLKGSKYGNRRRHLKNFSQWTEIHSSLWDSSSS
jgi:hypothetical protein